MKKCKSFDNHCCNDDVYYVVRGGIIGPRGPMGPAGRGIQIDGNAETVADLPSDNLFNGEAYLVGNSNPKYLYVYNTTSLQWINEGTLKGKDGIDGYTPTIGDNGNWFINGEDTGSPSRGLKGDTGPTFHPSYGSFYSNSEQNFAGSSKYSTIMLNEISSTNGITYDNVSGLFSFANIGVYEVTYFVTLTDFTELTTVALVSEDGAAKSASVQQVKLVNTQTSLKFISNFTAGRKWKLCLLSDTNITMGVGATNLVNASITFIQIPSE